MKKNILKKTKVRKNKGFTLVELLIALAIFSLMTGVVIFKHSEFRDKVILTDLAYQIALSIREAQVYGISVRKFEKTQSFNIGYGVHFNIQEGSPASGQAKYTFFADAFVNKNRGNLIYDDSASNPELVSDYKLMPGFKISKICAVKNKNESCHDNLDITFVRPDPRANIVAYTGSGSPQSDYSSACVKVTSSQGDSRAIEVYSTGQISVKSKCSTE